MGLFSEMKLAMPWGHISAKAWGSQQGLPVLCLHGWLDNANSFDRLIPRLSKDFHYVAMDFGGHGLSSHYSPGLPYYHQNFVNEVRRVVAALKWSRFSLIGHSFGGLVGGMMVDKLILLDATPFFLDINEVENLLTYKRRNIEHTLQVEASKKPSKVVSQEAMLQGFLTNNSHVGEECGALLLQRGTTQVATGSILVLGPGDSAVNNGPNSLSSGKRKASRKKEAAEVMMRFLAVGYLLVRKDLNEHCKVLRDETAMPGLVLNRDRRITKIEHCLDFVSKELFEHYIRKLQARVLLIKATQGYHDVRRENDANTEPMLFKIRMLRAVLKERFQFVEVTGNHYVHMNQPQLVASVINSFLQSKERIPAQL